MKVLERGERKRKSEKEEDLWGQKYFLHNEIIPHITTQPGCTETYSKTIMELQLLSTFNFHCSYKNNT